MDRNKNSTVILARVSSKSQEDEGYSLDSQLKLLEGYCQSNDLSVIKVYKIAETASKEQSRKVFSELLAYLKDNSIYNLAVEKTDRLTRNLKDAVAIDDWLNDNSDRMLHAVKENLRVHKEARADVKFMWNIHLSVAKKYSDNLREEAMKGWAEKLAQGWLPAVPPVGYMTVTDHGKRIHVPNPTTMNSVRAMFELYLKPGQSIESVAAKMREIGLTTRNGRPIPESHVHKILLNPFYVGINRFNGQEYPGAQTPIVRREVWEAVQDKLHGKRPKKQVRHNVSLKGVVTCATCGSQVSWQLQKGRYYGACQRRDERCKNRKYKYIREDVVQEVVKQELERLLCPSQSVLEWVVESMQSDVEKAADNRAEVEQSTKARIERIKSMDEALYDDKLAGVITQERYEAKHESFMNEIETLELAMASFDSTVTERKRRGIYMLELSQRAAKYYDEKDDDEKRQILIELFENIMFKNDAVSVSLKDQAELIAKYSSKTRELLGTRKSNDRTFTNSENNRGQNNEKSAENALYPLWQGRQDSNLQPTVLETATLPIELRPYQEN